MPDTPENPPPLRVYTCYIDGMLHTQAFPHGNLSGSQLEVELNRHFHDWLEMTAPAARDEGRVTGIRFSDHIE
jgi:hypothetical protein